MQNPPLNLPPDRLLKATRNNPFVLTVQTATRGHWKISERAHPMLVKVCEQLQVSMEDLVEFYLTKTKGESK